MHLCPFLVGNLTKRLSVEVAQPQRYAEVKGKGAVAAGSSTLITNLFLLQLQSKEDMYNSLFSFTVLLQLIRL